MVVDVILVGKWGGVVGLGVFYSEGIVIFILLVGVVVVGFIVDVITSFVSIILV